MLLEISIFGEDSIFLPILLHFGKFDGEIVGQKMSKNPLKLSNSINRESLGDVISIFNC